MSDSTRPAGWFADPTGRHQYRYWAGTEWTDRVADDRVTSTDPPIMTVAPERPATPVAPAPAAPPTPPTPAEPSPTVAAAPAPPPGTATRRASRSAFAAIAAVGGVALVVGSFLDAASASVGSGTFGVSVDKHYLDGDGPITLIVGVTVVALAGLLIVARAPRSVGWVVMLFGAIGGLVVVADILDVQDSIDQIEALGGSASIGPALWVCLVGAILAVVGGALVALVDNRDPR